LELSVAAEANIYREYTCIRFLRAYVQRSNQLLRKLVENWLNAMS